MNQARYTDALASLSDESGRFEVAWTAAHQAADFLMNDRPIDLEYTSKSSRTDLVSHMDKASESIIVEMIIEHFPSDGILGEEGANKEASNEFRWIIDPLDGTVNYLFGIPLWGVSIGLEIRGVVEFGIVVIPTQGETYTARRGQGAWRIRTRGATQEFSERIFVRKSTSIDTALVMTGFGYSPIRRQGQAEVVKQIIPRIADIRRGGAAVVDLCWFASGRSDAYFECGLNPWDYAAGALIAQEAGGVVKGLDNDDFSDFLIAATPEVFDELRRMLVDSGARKLL